ncbi:putative carbamate kinase [Nostocoides japonicum T1-X7]|uniref:Carbamate kinase n=1 Tax=Nostocoides japonicum T1-X7 TaxID=1194083 RepID=A0A077LZ28_9MICO|nr:carbamate kinase [Tetrasphaera japonica]CCH78896.1 putative carbamate kinase [Tetrasphaera japonica T1-X7]
MRVLLALGGNAMVGPDGSTHPVHQMAAVRTVAGHVARLVSIGHDVVITHGNGPQVGNILVKQEMAATVLPPVPLDWCGAMTQGSIGFLFLDELDAAFAEAGLDRRSTAQVTRTLVAADDPAFATPTKPVGRFLPEEDARVMVAHGQNWVDTGEQGWRRVVPSPEPLEIVDAPAIRAALEAGFTVVANGGGGIPVIRTSSGRLEGVEAVVDKDLGAVTLARAIGVDALVLATDVEHAVVGWGTPDARPVEQVTPSVLRDLADEGHFPAGSMGPKVDAACRFVEQGGGLGVITSLDRIPEALKGETGTRVVPE